MTAQAVIVAAGSGSRIGGDPKQFRLLGGHPMLAWSCALFSGHPAIQRLAVVVPRDIAGAPPEWLGEFGAAVVAGGMTRRDSVAAGLAALAGDGAGGGPDAAVLVHDAARPFVSAELVGRLAEAGREGPVIPVLPLADAVKRIGREGGRVERTLDRSTLRAAQTPQAFPFGLIRRLHADAADTGDPPPDDAAMCEAAGIAVRTIPGERWAFKVTHAEDLAVAEWLVATGRVRWPGDPA